MPLDDYERDELHRINQAYAARGLPVVMPEDFAEICSMAQDIDESDWRQPSPQGGQFDSNPIAQRMAGHLVSKHVAVWSRYGGRTIDVRFCPEYDDSLESLTRIFVLVYTTLDAYPLTDILQYRHVAEELLGKVEGCQAGVTAKCQHMAPAKFVTVKRGDYLCLFKICLPCREALETLSVDSEDYTGPPEWHDDREANPPADPFLPPNPWVSDDPWAD